jgi:hypothetical protein
MARPDVEVEERRRRQSLTSPSDEKGRPASDGVCALDTLWTSNAYESVRGSDTRMMIMR